MVLMKTNTAHRSESAASLAITRRAEVIREETGCSWNSACRQAENEATNQEGNTMERKTILSYERMNSSVNGNPRYRIVFTDGTIAPMMSDSGTSYQIGNPEMREGSTVDVDFTRAGNIRWMRAL